MTWQDPGRRGRSARWRAAAALAVAPTRTSDVSNANVEKRKDFGRRSRRQGSLIWKSSADRLKSDRLTKSRPKGAAGADLLRSSLQCVSRGSAPTRPARATAGRPWFGTDDPARCEARESRSG